MTTLVVGIGHPDRGDDAAGLLVAGRISEVAGIVTREVTGDPSLILTDPAWDTADEVVLVDAVRTGAAVGTVHRWYGPALLETVTGRVAGSASGTHDLDVAATIRLAARLGRLPAALTLIGIEVTSFTPGDPPDPAVVAAADRVASELAGAAQGYLSSGPSGSPSAPASC